MPRTNVCRRKKGQSDFLPVPDNYAIVIPALDPDSGLPEYVAALSDCCNVSISLVDGESV